MGGFSLVELMLSLSLGLALSGVMLQGLMAEGQNGARFSRLLRERALQQRTLELVKSDFSQATSVSANPALETSACGTSDRQPVLYLRSTVGPIMYSVGKSPSRLWRGLVLMRCGPSYGLDGFLSLGIGAQNRVIMDGIKTVNQATNSCDVMNSYSHGSEWISLGDSRGSPLVVCSQLPTGLVRVFFANQKSQIAKEKMMNPIGLLLEKAVVEPVQGRI